jgi:hypothetical protein
VSGGKNQHPFFHIFHIFHKIWIISNLRDRMFGESLARVRKERQIPPQALYRAGAGQALAG